MFYWIFVRFSGLKFVENLNFEWIGELSFGLESPISIYRLNFHIKPQIHSRFLEFKSFLATCCGARIS